MIESIKNITQIFFGLHLKPLEKEVIQYLKAGDFDHNGLYQKDPFSYVSQESIKPNQFLQYGDVLLPGKGHRLFAWAVPKDFPKAVAASIFYVIRVDTNIILPEYLALLLNQPNYQKQLKTLGAGSLVLSIKKSELQNIKVPTPKLYVQKDIIELLHLHQQEIELTKQIITQKEALFNAYIQNKITQS